MKKIILTMVTLLTSFVSINAMTYDQARDEALFLTDKMAYELNLNEQQYEAAYEINLDYLLGLRTESDLYAEGWRQRRYDFEYILNDWQYSAFCAASYFFRPVIWRAGFWHFGIYSHYPYRDRFYFSRPACYVSYRGGGHSWRSNGGRSWYQNRVHVYRPAGVTHRGMRESWRGGSPRVIHNGPVRNGGVQGGSYRGNQNNGVSRPNGSYNNGSSNRPNNSSNSGVTRPNGSYNNGSPRPNNSSNSGVTRPNGSYNNGSPRPNNSSNSGVTRPNGSYNNGSPRPNNSFSNGSRPSNGSTGGGFSRPSSTRATVGNGVSHGGPQRGGARVGRM